MSINLPLSLLAEMVVFVRVVEAGSFSEVARQLGTSPSAVSRSISRLEKALALLKPCSSATMVAYPVSSVVNSARYDGPDCVAGVNEMVPDQF